MLITSRNHNVLKRFTLDGHYISTIPLPGSFVCRPVIHDRFVYAAVFRSTTNRNLGSGYITILDENDHVISTPGGTEPVYINDTLQTQSQQQAVFVHPHDVCIDSDDSVYVCQWNANKIYPMQLKRV